MQTASCIHSCDYDPHSLIYRVVWTLGGLDRWRHFCVGSDYLDIWGNIDFDIYIRTKMNDDFMNYFQNYGIGITGGPTGKKRMTTIDIMTFTLFDMGYGQCIRIVKLNTTTWGRAGCFVGLVITSF